MAKITYYDAAGNALEFEDTPRRRRWAKGKRMTTDEPGTEETPDPEPDDYPIPYAELKVSEE